MTYHSSPKTPSPILSFLKEQFAFVSSQRLGIAVLIVILLFIIILPLFFRSNEIPVEDIDRLRKEMDVFLVEMNKRSTKSKSDTLFPFDPNVVDSASLIRLGFLPSQAKIIMNYRNKGGRFYTRESFGKSFVVSDEMYTRLYPYIDINRETSKNRKPDSDVDELNKYRHIKPVEAAKEFKESKTVDKQPYTVELNSADFDELLKFHGIGEYYAKRIVEYRDNLGGFYNAEQLMEIKGIDSIRFNMFRKQIVIDTAHIRQIKVNSATENELARHPYIDNFTAKAIIKYRSFRGTINSNGEFLKERVITENQLKKLSVYLEY